MNVTTLSVCMFVCIAMLVVAQLLGDIDEAEQMNLMLRRRAHLLPRRWWRHVVVALARCCSVLRICVMPMMIIGATSGLLLHGPLTSSNLLLDGISITVITTMDNCMGWALSNSENAAALEAP